ncbi:hypothetical protein [Hyphomicrobium sp.]|uniref:hypothetical protein n=1 Tax=Hyphomicrobium sp. TaxID=82 RepID=UPI000F9A7BF0|nr:hypothetical protein [Hyphomicrobium sp.]RUO97527.1 MAG: hypothetical protein EKK30_16435 [Hyphomicrobium sp.]
MRQNKNESADSTLDLSGLLTIRTINEAKEVLWRALKDNRALRLLIDDEADVDVAGIQLILSAKAYATSESIDLSLSAPISGRGLNVMERGGFIAGLSDEGRRFWLLEGR